MKLETLMLKLICKKLDIDIGDVMRELKIEHFRDFPEKPMKGQYVVIDTQYGLVKWVYLREDWVYLLENDL